VTDLMERDTARQALIVKYREAKNEYEKLYAANLRNLMVGAHDALFKATAEIGYFNRLNRDARITPTDCVLPTL
jgi:hypothetical protein